MVGVNQRRPNTEPVLKSPPPPGGRVRKHVSDMFISAARACTSTDQRFYFDVVVDLLGRVWDILLEKTHRCWVSTKDRLVTLRWPTLT